MSPCWAGGTRRTARASSFRLLAPGLGVGSASGRVASSARVRGDPRRGISPGYGDVPTATHFGTTRGATSARRRVTTSSSAWTRVCTRRLWDERTTERRAAAEKASRVDAPRRLRRGGGRGRGLRRGERARAEPQPPAVATERAAGRRFEERPRVARSERRHGRWASDVRRARRVVGIFRRLRRRRELRTARDVSAVGGSGGRAPPRCRRG